jgi:hypothetical protein
MDLPLIESLSHEAVLEGVVGPIDTSLDTDTTLGVVLQVIALAIMSLGLTTSGKETYYSGEVDENINVVLLQLL